MPVVGQRVLCLKIWGQRVFCVYESTKFLQIRLDLMISGTIVSVCPHLPSAVQHLVHYAKAFRGFSPASFTRGWMPFSGTVSVRDMFYALDIFLKWTSVQKYDLSSFHLSRGIAAFANQDLVWIIAPNDLWAYQVFVPRLSPLEQRLYAFPAMFTIALCSLQFCCRKEFCTEGRLSSTRTVGMHALVGGTFIYPKFKIAQYDCPYESRRSASVNDVNEETFRTHTHSCFLFLRHYVWCVEAVGGGAAAVRHK